MVGEAGTWDPAVEDGCEVDEVVVACVVGRLSGREVGKGVAVAGEVCRRSGCEAGKLVPAASEVGRSSRMHPSSMTQF